MRKGEKKSICWLGVMAALSLLLTACGASTDQAAEAVKEGLPLSEGAVLSEDAAEVYYHEEREAYHTEEYNPIKENGFRSVATSPLSTFSADVDTASYSNLRRMIMEGYSLTDIPEGAVRIEELLNYFSYGDQLPKEGEPFGITVNLADCPWNPESKLMRIGLKTEKLDFSDAPESNLVFLIDVSGSMDDPQKLGLLQRAFSLLTDELTHKDRVSIITYAGREQVILEGVSGSEKEIIKKALENLFAQGSTNGSEAILRAYDLAEENYIEGGNNRIILATDGDLNVGITDESSLKRLVEEKRESGIYLSVMGFGSGNLKDNKMETLADHGNGNYSYLDSYGEAKKVLVEELGANFVTVAEDVKFQIEFNPAVVKGYRLLGYENRILADEEFADDDQDAGEIGAGHSMTVLYELVTVDSRMEIDTPELKYQKEEEGTDSLPKSADQEEEWLTISVRYKEPSEEESKRLSYPVKGSIYQKEMDEEMKFAAAVVEFGMLIRDSAYKGNSSFDHILALLEEVDLTKDTYREEFQYLVKLLKKNTPN